jgi:hypothetical protein
LQELRAALTGGPAHIRDENLADIADELLGLDEASTHERIKALGDASAIAADAISQVSALADGNLLRHSRKSGCCSRVKGCDNDEDH